MIAKVSSYFKNKVLVDRAAQVERMRVAQIFYPVYAKAQTVTEADVDALKCFRFSSRPDLAAGLQKMKSELVGYNALVKQVKPLEDRQVPAPGIAGKDGRMVDSFDMSQWWRANKAKLPAFFKILRAVAAHSPNSCAPEAVFSVLNDTFDDDQKKAYADYIELSLQLQYASRTP